MIQNSFSCDRVCELHKEQDSFKLGQYYFNQDENPDGPYDIVSARAYFEDAIAEDPKQHELLWYQLGRIDFLEGKFDDALEKFDIQIEYFGDAVPNVYYMIGLVHGYKARREGVENSWLLAEENFLTFIEYAPTAAWPRVDLAWVYFSQGKFEAMRPIVAEGLKHDPNNPWLLNMYGLSILNTSDDKNDARLYFERAGVLADQLTEKDWGKIYPGNNPDEWALGLKEFRATVAKNIALLN